MRSALVQSILPAGALAAALQPMGSTEAVRPRSKIGITPGQRLPGYVASSNWTSEDLVGIDLAAHPDMFRPAYDADPKDTEFAIRARDMDPSQFEARDDVDTQVRINSNRIDWGCDGDIQKPIEAAVAAICYEGWCTEGEEYLHPVKWTDGGAIADYNLVFKVSGRYEGTVRHYLIEGLQSTSTEETWTVDEVHWLYGGVTGTHGGGVCQMTRFADHIQIERRFDGYVDELYVTVELRPTSEVCLAQGAMQLIEDQLRGIGPGFFGSSPRADPRC